MCMKDGRKSTTKTSASFGKLPLITASLRGTNMPAMKERQRLRPRSFFVYEKNSVAKLLIRREFRWIRSFPTRSGQFILDNYVFIYMYFILFVDFLIDAQSSNFLYFQHRATRSDPQCSVDTLWIPCGYPSGWHPLPNRRFDARFWLLSFRPFLDS